MWGLACGASVLTTCLTRGAIVRCMPCNGVPGGLQKPYNLQSRSYGSCLPRYLQSYPKP